VIAEILVPRVFTEPAAVMPLNLFDGYRERICSSDFGGGALRLRTYNGAKARSGFSSKENFLVNGGRDPSGIGTCFPSRLGRGPSSGDSS
jgi:hypothetical protein